MQLVLTPPFDAEADHLIDRLRARGAEVARFNPADFPARAEISLEHTSGGAIRTQLHANGQIVDLDRVRSVWWHPSIEYEVKSFAQDAWSFITCAWLPARPSVVQRAQFKAVQFAIAGLLGFELPSGDTLSQRPAVRVIVVGERVFAAQVGPATYRQHRLPDELRLGCVRLVRYLGLRFGAIDLRRTVDGRYVFGALNPSGQHLWIERATDMPITEAIADELLGTTIQRRVPLTIGASDLTGVAA